MPRYIDRFQSHMPEGDPRTPLFGAGGCPWPTVPAYRYLLVSAHATGIWEFLNDDGILIEFVSFGDNHDLIQYEGPLGPGPLEYAQVWKEYVPGAPTFAWELSLKHEQCGGVLFIHKEFSLQPCNRNWLLGNYECASGYPGETGHSFSMRQVEYNKNVPPFWNP